MIRVLFVCLGNICRSPMAEGLFRDLVESEGLADRITVESAGTGGWHVGEPPHEGTQDQLSKRGISTHGMKGRKFEKEDTEKFDYIIAMDAENLGEIHKMAGYDSDAYTARLLDFVPKVKVNDVPDPYYTGNFDEVFELIKKGCHRLLDFIREREDL